MSLTITQEEYEAFVSLAQRGTYEADGSIHQERALKLHEFLSDIEKRNGIERHSLWIQWQDPHAALPPGARFPKSWPPNLRFFLQLVTRPIAKSDVIRVVEQRCKSALEILVTPDPAALVGWTRLEDYFHEGG